MTVAIFFTLPVRVQWLLLQSWSRLYWQRTRYAVEDVAYWFLHDFESARYRMPRFTHAQRNAFVRFRRQQTTDTFATFMHTLGYFGPFTQDDMDGWVGLVL